MSALRFTAGIRAHKQEKTRNQRSLTFKCSLAMVGGVKGNTCRSIQRATVHQHDPKISWSISTIPGHCI